MADQRQRVLYQRGKFRILAWAERVPSEPAPRLYVGVYERRGDTWHNITVWPASLDRAPWWKPWERRHELMPVVERCLRQVEALEHADFTAESAIDAAAEVLEEAEPLVNELRLERAGVTGRYDRVREEYHAHGDEDPVIYPRRATGQS